MVEKSSSSAQSFSGWRMKLGTLLFLFSIVLPLFGIAILNSLALTAPQTASFSAAILIGAEVVGLAAVAVMGKQGFAYLKNAIFGLLKKYGPPKTVSKKRYTIGLVMFSIPILFGWIAVYTADLIPGYLTAPLPYAIGGDILLLLSLCTLGGDFWDKIRALFIYDARVTFKGED